MLFRSLHQHIASTFTLDLERERRLLCFAEGSVNSDSSSDSESTNTNENAEGENGAGTVQQGQEQTSNNVRNALENDEKDKINPLELAQKIKELEEGASKFQEKITKVESLVRKHAAENAADVLQSLAEYRENMHSMLGNAAIMHQLLQTIGKWQDDKFCQPLDYISGLNAVFGMVDIAELQLPQDLQSKSENWDNLTTNDKKLLHDEVDAYVKTQVDVEKMLKTCDEHITDMEKAYGEALKLNATLETLENAPEKKVSLRSFLNDMGIEFLSLKQIGLGFKKYWDAFNKARQQWDERKSSDVAQKIGSSLGKLPFGQQINSTLDAEVENKHNEERDEHKKYLESKNFQYDESFAELQRQQGQPNKMRAVVEYMAENGWLYEYDRKTRTAFGMEISLPSSWNESVTESYMIQLALKDSEGQDKMKKRGIELVGTAEGIPPIIEELENELKRKNYWSCYGILETAYNKGKIGESGTWVATTIMRHIRDNEHARKYFPIDLMDQLGNLGIAHPAWTNTFFKVNRTNITQWQKTNDPKRFKEAGDLARAITLIEQDFNEFAPNEFTGEDGQNRKNRAIAQILASQVVTINGRKFSIFDPKYDFYRKTILTSPTTTEPGKADDDFYGNISDALLIGQDGFTAILATGSTGDLNNDTKARSYWDQIIKLHDSVKTTDEKTEANFRAEMRKKFNTYFKQHIADDSRKCDKWRAFTRRSETEPFLFELEARGLLDRDRVLNVFRVTKHLEIFDAKYGTEYAKEEEKKKAAEAKKKAEAEKKKEEETRRKAAEEKTQATEEKRKEKEEQAKKEKKAEKKEKKRRKQEKKKQKRLQRTMDDILQEIRNALAP